MLGDPKHLHTGNVLTVTLQGYCENPGLECDLDYWEYRVQGAFPNAPEGPGLQTLATGFLYKPFPKNLSTWWQNLLSDVIRCYNRGGTT